MSIRSSASLTNTSKKSIFRTLSWSKDISEQHKLRELPNPVGKSNELHIAISNGDNRQIKKILSKKKSRTLYKEVDENNLTPMLLALKKDDLEIIDIFFNWYETQKLDINEQDQDGFALLHSAVSIASDTSLVHLLKYHKIRVDILTKDQTSPLHYFCQKFSSPNCQEPFDIMKEKGADVNLQNNHGETPLHKAMFNTSGNFSLQYPPNFHIHLTHIQ